MLKLCDITHTYTRPNGEQVGLHDLNLSFPKGEITSVIGRSGCGKTTLLRLIAGLETPAAGRLQWSETQRKIGYVFQEPRLFPWLSVKANILLPLRHRPVAEKQAALERVLTLVNLHDVANASPDTLSGGMAQRVGIARALVHDPNILLLDEAFSALDALTRFELHKDFADLQRRLQMTTVLVTHDVQEAVDLSRTIYRLDAGRLVKTYTIDAERKAQWRDTIYQDFFQPHL